jgi:hypothetical protein
MDVPQEEKASISNQMGSKKPGRRQTFITGGWPPNMRTRESAAEYGRCP